MTKRMGILQHRKRYGPQQNEEQDILPGNHMGKINAILRNEHLYIQYRETNAALISGMNAKAG